MNRCYWLNQILYLKIKSSIINYIKEEEQHEAR